MPELPEVETIRRDLEKSIVGHRVAKVTIHDGRVLRDISPCLFIQKIKNQTFAAIERRGKALIFDFTNGWHLFVQLRMTGHWIVADKSAAKGVVASAKITFTLSPKRYLIYNDQRVLGTIRLIQDLNAQKFIRTLGVEPFSDEFTADKLLQIFSNRKAPIKTALMNQGLVAGIGNIYASEILFASRIDPRRPAQKLSRDEVRRIRKETRVVLTAAIDKRGTSMRDYRDAAGEKGNFLKSLRVYGRTHSPCANCRRPIRKIVQAGRSTFFCEHCQR